MNNKYNISQSVSLFFLILVTGFLHAQTITANFNIVKQCKSHTVLENKSSSNPPGLIIGYLWEINDEIGIDTIFSTSNNLILAFDKSGKYKIKLTALTEGFGIATHAEEIMIYDAPNVDVEYWDDLVCSNTDSSFYIMEYKSGFNYSWDISDIPAKYVIQISGLESNQLKIKWGELEQSEITKQFNLYCKISSSENDGTCETTITRPVILLSSTVPFSENLQIIAKPNDKSILFCIIDKSESYFFEWGYIQPDGEIKKFSRTGNNYYYFDEGIIESRKYFVEISNRDFTYCSITVFYDYQKSGEPSNLEPSSIIEVLHVFPNPAAENIHVDLLNNSEAPKLLSVSIFNYMSKIEAVQKFDLKVGMNKITIPSGFLNSGHYYLKFDVAGNNSLIEKIIVINTF
jgi:PKD repeat protein